MSQTRQLAWQALRRIRSEASYSNLVLAKARQSLERRDAQLLTQIVYGTLRNQRLIDAVIAEASSRPLAKVNADLLDLLRLSVYQILWLERVPKFAVVAEAVELAKKQRGQAVAGFINAVLRKIDPSATERCLAVVPPDERLALRYSLPAELDSLLAELLSDAQREALAKNWCQPAPLVLRCNLRRNTVAELSATLCEQGGSVSPGRYAPAALRVEGISEPFGSRPYLSGAFSAQDEAAQLCSLALGTLAPEARVLDACAGVGGKTCALLEAQPQLEVVAVDRSERKLELCREHLRRLGLAAECKVADVARLVPSEIGNFDAILLDAPCSALGVIGRHPELKWRFQPTQIAALAELQRRLLESCWSLLRNGGVLVYSVCSLTRVEGEQQVQRLLDQQRDAILDPPNEHPFDQLWPTGRCGLTLWPHLHGTDGFFIARLRKIDEHFAD